MGENERRSGKRKHMRDFRGIEGHLEVLMRREIFTRCTLDKKSIESRLQVSLKGRQLRGSVGKINGKI